jgi:hypothetical protein
MDLPKETNIFITLTLNIHCNVMHLEIALMF